jgi:hypothetical protein
MAQPLNVNVQAHYTWPTEAEIEESVERLRAAWFPEPAAGITAPPKQTCAFCGELGAPQVIETGLRCQAETWHVCHRTSCNETIPYHRERIEAGLVDCSETRSATLRWVRGKLGIK